MLLLQENIQTWKMDILKKFLNNPAFDHLAENIIRFMDTDEAMETMIESEFLSDE